MEPSVVSVDREYAFSERDFAVIRRLVAEHAGIALSEAKRDMVYSRLVRRIRELELGSFREYCQLLQSGDEAEFASFINAITTNLTAFFREPHHFDFLAATALPALLRARQTSRRLRLWSSGCSTGEEPYSMAMVLRESLPAAQHWDTKILATDLDSNVLAHAAAGIYTEDRLGGVEAKRLQRWFKRGRGDNAGKVRVRQELAELITFKQLNLMNTWPMHGPFDVIFCRNVIIYFDKSTQKTLFERYAQLLADDGYLFIGHSETLYRVTDRFRPLGQTIYAKSG